MKTINNYISNEKFSSLDEYITEKLKIGKMHYICQPEDRDELKSILKERLAKDKNANLNDIDVSKITDMSWLFYNLNPHNIDVSQWNVSNVETMNGMFFDCRNLNCDLSDWDVSSVKNMKAMFYDCKHFNCDLSDWHVSKVEDMLNMFYNCRSLIKNIPSWYKDYEKIR